jgi:hypothetical protein
MHSDLDADRMDYLMRDAHYTGIKYGQFDREYILANLATFDAGKGQVGFGVTETAQHAVEDFLMARFSWYSQIVRNPASAKFDIMAAHIAKGFLERDQIHQFHDLLAMIEARDERFFWWNDVYFMNRCQELRYGDEISDPKVAELTEMLLYRRPPKTLHHPLFEHRLLSFDGGDRDKLVTQLEAKVAEFERVLEKHGKGGEWILADIPERDVVFTRGMKHLMKKRRADNLYAEPEPVKIVTKSGEPALLIERENSLMARLSGVVNFVPNVYASDSAAALLKARGLVEH